MRAQLNIEAVEMSWTTRIVNCWDMGGSSREGTKNLL